MDDNQSGSIFCGLAPLLYADNSLTNVSHEFPQSPSVFYEEVMYYGIAWTQTFKECFEFVTFHYSNGCIFSCKDRQEQICTIQAQLTTLQMAFTYNRKSLKKSLDTSFPSTHVRICVKDATPLKRGVEKDKNKRQKLKSSFINAVSIHYRCMYAILWGIRHCLRRQ